MPYFSITIPVYNVEKYINQCLDSVLEQSFKDFEVIILDDGSTDKSGSICDEYCRKDKRFRVIHDKNMGLLMARRRALSYVMGKYVLFLDSDDFWEKNLLESIYNVTSEHEVDMVFFRYRAINDENAEVYQQKKLLMNKELIQNAGKFLCFKLATDFEYNALWLKCIKRERIDITADYGVLSKVAMGEDALQTACILQNINTFLYLDLPLYNYRVNIKSMTTKITEKYLRDYVGVRSVIEDKVVYFFGKESLEYMQKMQYDIRGFVGVLADSAISVLINKEQWNKMKKEIHSSYLFHSAYQRKSELNLVSRIYLLAIMYGNRSGWKILGKIKKMLKYMYDRQKDNR